MNLTLSVDERVLERAREVAREQGTSVNALIRQYLENLAGVRSGKDTAQELRRLWASGGGDSGGKKFRRDELYADRTR